MTQWDRFVRHPPLIKKTVRVDYNRNESLSSVVAHETPTVTSVKYPTKRFGKVVGGIQNARNVTHDDVVVVFPILDGKMLNQNMTGAFGRDAGVDHIDGGLIITIERCWRKLGKPEFGEDGAKIASLLGSGYSSVKFGLGGAGGGGGLGLALVRDATAREHESEASGGAAVAKIIGMCSVNKTRSPP